MHVSWWEGLPDNGNLSFETMGVWRYLPARIGDRSGPANLGSAFNSEFDNPPRRPACPNVDLLLEADVENEAESEI